MSRDPIPVRVTVRLDPDCFAAFAARIGKGRISMQELRSALEGLLGADIEQVVSEWREDCQRKQVGRGQP